MAMAGNIVVVEHIVEFGIATSLVLNSRIHHCCDLKRPRHCGTHVEVLVVRELMDFMGLLIPVNGYFAVAGHIADPGII